MATAYASPCCLLLRNLGRLHFYFFPKPQNRKTKTVINAYSCKGILQQPVELLEGISSRPLHFLPILFFGISLIFLKCYFVILNFTCNYTCHQLVGCHSVALCLCIMACVLASTAASIAGCVASTAPLVASLAKKCFVVG